jgi:hypothetical protein
MERNVHKISVRKPEGKNHSEELDADGRIMLERILQKKGVRMWDVFIWLRRGTSGRLL